MVRYRFSISVVAASTLFVLSASGATASAPPVGPGKGAGERSVTPPPAKPEIEKVAPAKAPVVASPAPAAHRTGKAPAVPKATMPQGALRAVPDSTARRQVVGGPPQDDILRGIDDPELRALREAEQAMFRRALPGLKNGWSWDLPQSPRGDGPEVTASGLPPASNAAELASALLPQAREEEWLGSLALPNIPVKLDETVIRYLKFYRDTERGRNIVRTWAAKVGRYTPALKAAFARFGLPTDLVYLSLIESGHNPTVISPAGAAGLWQFIPESGRMYGLTVDRWVDERLDPERATEAAAKYLSDLKQRFGSWELAMAGYNMGHGGLLRVVQQYSSNDFWRLVQYEAALPWETTLYVPKIAAIAIVMSNRKAFGLDTIEADLPVHFDTVLVEPGMPLLKVAQAISIPVESLVALNPQYLAGHTPPVAQAASSAATQSRASTKPRRWPVHVPKGNGTTAAAALAKSLPSADKLTTTVVRLGDTTESIASRYHTTEAVVRKLNQMGAGENAGPGSVLFVPALSAGALLQPDSEDFVVVSHQRFSYPGRQRVFYRARAGDELGTLARAFGVTVADVVAWNGLDQNAKLQQGMTLQFFPASGADLSAVRHVLPRNTEVLETGSPEFIEFFEMQKGRHRYEVAAQAGDTLLKVGARYGMSTSMMERINRIPRDTKLKPGDRVVVYTNRSVPNKEQPVRQQAALPPLKAPSDEISASAEPKASETKQN